MLRFSICSRTAVIVLLLFGAGCLLYGQGDKSPVEICGDLPTQSEMNDCAAQQAKKADAALNDTYRELLAKARDNKTATEKVIAAEKAWVVFRDAELAAEWPVADGQNPNLLYGSVHQLCYFNERAAMTWDRVKVLKELMRSEDGDICASGLAHADRHDFPPGCRLSPSRPPRLLACRTIR